MNFIPFLLAIVFSIGSAHGESSQKTDAAILLDSPVIVSLSRLMDRYHTTREFMEKRGFTNIRRFDAIDGLNTPKEFFDDLHIFHGTPGQKGCAASHLILWKTFLEEPSGREFLFVCEDDNVPHVDFATLFPLYWQETKEDFDLLLVGNLLAEPANEDLIVQIPAWCTHAYIISKKGAKKLVELFPQHGGIIDEFLKDLMTRNQIICYSYNGKKYPDPVHNRSVDTGICYQNRYFRTTIPR